MTLSCGEGLVLSAESGGKKRELKVGAGDRASLAGAIGACSAQNREEVVCFEDVGAVARDDWVLLEEDVVSVTEEKAQEA